jgi:hypothetical protein
MFMGFRFILIYLLYGYCSIQKYQVDIIKISLYYDIIYFKKNN